MTGSAQPVTYTIKGGDNLWDIAIKNGVSLSALEEMNPGLNPKRLSIGKEIYLYQTQPFITVSFTELVTSQERISYNVIYEDTDSLYRGQTQVKSVGSYGSRIVTSEITKENGVATATKVLSEELISEPVTQVALRGTQALPVFTGSSSGELGLPLGSIQVISAYGSRGGGSHRGVDLKDVRGAPIYAAADGVVTFSGYSGSYGNIVKISHGNGLETYYSHNETNLVSVGDVVSKGQQIGTVGDSGNARGTHVHFEVRVNGSPKNPMNYI
jgi:murein DD-endopeptidase MepM/ murein hydrolase activator NlpD